MKMIFLGPPGSGKGTYASRIGPKLGIPHISTGDLLRAARDDPEHGKTIRHYQDTGGLVPDEITIAVLEKRIGQNDAKKGFILDGYPRNTPQAQALDKITDIDTVINLVVPDRVVIARLSSRRQCRKCSRIFNVLYLKPKKQGICDACGGGLYQRDDDKPEVIKERLKEYEKNTSPLTDFYRKRDIVIDMACNSVDIPPEIMVDKIMKSLKEHGKI